MKSSNYNLVTLISKHSYSAQATPSYLTFNLQELFWSERNPGQNL